MDATSNIIPGPTYACPGRKVTNDPYRKLNIHELLFDEIKLTKPAPVNTSIIDNQNIYV